MNFYKSTHRYFVCGNCGKTVKMKINIITDTDDIKIFPNNNERTTIKPVCCNDTMINIDKEMYDIIRSANKKGYEYSLCNKIGNTANIFIKLKINISKLPDNIDIFNKDEIIKYLNIRNDIIYNEEILFIKLDNEKNMYYDILIMPNSDNSIYKNKSAEDIVKNVKYYNRQYQKAKYNRIKHIISMLRDLSK